MTIMKKYIYFIFIMVSVVLLTGCKEKTRVQKVKDFRNELTKEDTVQMLKLSDQCMELLKAQKTNEALSMLYEYDSEKSEILPLSNETKKRLERQFKIFPVLEYERDYFSFLLEGVNDVRYRIKFAEEENPEKNGECITRFMLNPVKVDGSWYITVKNGSDFDELQN